MAFLGPAEIVLIVVVIAIFFFGKFFNCFSKLLFTILIKLKLFVIKID